MTGLRFYGAITLGSLALYTYACGSSTKNDPAPVSPAPTGQASSPTPAPAPATDAAPAPTAAAVPSAPAAAAPAAPATAAPVAVAAVVTLSSAYTSNCVGCHGTTGKNGLYPIPAGLTAATVVSTVRNGFSAAGMPAFSAAAYSNALLNADAAILGK